MGAGERGDKAGPSAMPVKESSMGTKWSVDGVGMRGSREIASAQTSPHWLKNQLLSSGKFQKIYELKHPVLIPVL